MSLSLQRARKAALAIGGLLAFLLVFAWLALPGILQTQAQNIVAEKSGHRLTLGKPEINPLALSLRIKDLKLDDPEGAPLLAFRELYVDLSVASLATRGVVIEQLQLDGLAASATLRDDARQPHNWSRLLAAFAGKEEKKPNAPPTGNASRPASVPALQSRRSRGDGDNHRLRRRLRSAKPKPYDGASYRQQRERHPVGRK